MDIPIWPGSSSFATTSASFYNTPSTGSRPTAFGYYDSDPIFKVEADKVADWCARSVGYPIMDVELQDLNLWAAFEEATTKFSTMVNMFNAKDYILTLQGTPTGSDLSGQNITPNLGNIIQMAQTYGSEAGAGGDVDWKKGGIKVARNVSGSYPQTYDLNALWADVSESGKRIEVKRIFHDTPPAISRYFDPTVGIGSGAESMLDGFGWGNYSPAVSFMVMPLYADLLRTQAIEMSDTIRKSAFTFELHNNKLTLFPIPDANFTLYFDYVLVDDRNNPIATPSGSVSDLSNVPFERIQFGAIKDIGVQWIYEYATATAKEMLGLVRSKYTTIPVPGADASLNGSDLMQQGREDKQNLILELKELLLSMGRQAQLESESMIATAMQQQLAKVPSKIYIK